jgi:hypothetical protein
MDGTTRQPYLADDPRSLIPGDAYLCNPRDNTYTGIAPNEIQHLYRVDHEGLKHFMTRSALETEFVNARAEFPPVSPEQARTRTVTIAIDSYRKQEITKALGEVLPQPTTHTSRITGPTQDGEEPTLRL